MYDISIFPHNTNAFLHNKFRKCHYHPHLNCNRFIVLVHKWNLYYVLKIMHEIGYFMS